MKKLIKIPPQFYKKLNVKIKIPTIKCKICGITVLDTPTNRIYNLSIKEN